MRTRSERRHHHQRMIDRVKKFPWLKSLRHFLSQEQQEEHILHLAENRKQCSCHMCGNPRHHQKDKLTMQEKRQLIASHDWDE
jgi:dsDNA-binding SOS-regulon protein